MMKRPWLLPKLFLLCLVFLTVLLTCTTSRFSFALSICPLWPARRTPCWSTSQVSVGHCDSSRHEGRAAASVAAHDDDHLGHSNFSYPGVSADRVSSPKRYAQALNLTVEQVEDRKQQHRRACEALHLQLSSMKASSSSSSSPTTNDHGPDKHALICEHRLQYGHHPFVCDRCWSYQPICVCETAQWHRKDRQQQGHEAVERQSPPPSPPWLPPQLDVVIWIHHKEWGLTSNTGGLLPLLLEGEKEDHDGDSGNSVGRCTLRMKGLPAHDTLLQQEILDKHSSGEYLVVVLWPNDTKKRQSKQGRFSSCTTTTLDQVKQALAEAQSTRKSATKVQRVVIMAVDGTWRNARRMVSRLPDSIPRLDLTPPNASAPFLPTTASLLSPIRSRGPSGRQDNGDNLVCTAEAVTAALVALGMDSTDGDRILDLARTKVDRVRRYRGHENKAK